MLHVVDAEDWEARRTNGEYRPPSLDAQGFVHLSPADAVLAVAQYNHAGDAEPLLVVVDRTCLGDVRYEEGDGRAFPHLYGPLPVDAVTDVLAFPREEGRFVLPTELRD
ncbi:DUF952 domain-containing protein [Salinirubellus salinus]|uniref:DUF952 domain-containing protein n=1 Tax=Salinirubellus salinus TaxID=1364945 RepID=A0A9E7R6L0_9EURY|nr:DUF952 domain-containing protein [Salinirubellus salinus]UWM56870.1 DUF952 domain-containing protein [Salinirubellus salinus]